MTFAWRGSDLFGSMSGCAFLSAVDLTGLAAVGAGADLAETGFGGGWVGLTGCSSRRGRNGPGLTVVGCGGATTTGWVDGAVAGAGVRVSDV